MTLLGVLKWSDTANHPTAKCYFSNVTNAHALTSTAGNKFRVFVEYCGPDVVKLNLIRVFSGPESGIWR